MKSLWETVRCLRNGSLTSSATAKQSLTAIRQKNARLKAYACVDPRDVQRQVTNLDQRAKQCLFESPLHGITVAVKDLYDVVPYPTRSGSDSYTRYPQADASVVRLFRDKGALVVGKTVSSEFACSFDPVETLNPLNGDHTPGGSSCGSAAAVASGMCFVGIGTQTAGSVLRPAAYTGTTGFKPTAGLFPMDGVTPVSPPLDQFGYITRTLSDATLVFDSIMGKSYFDCILKKTINSQETIELVYPRKWIESRASSDTIQVFDELIEFLQTTQNFKIHDLDITSDYFDFIEKIHRVIMLYGLVQSQKNIFKQINSVNYKTNIYRLIQEGLAITTEEYEHALQQQAIITKQIDDIFNSNSSNNTNTNTNNTDTDTDTDSNNTDTNTNTNNTSTISGILLPTTPSLAPRKEEGTGNPVFCSPWTLTGHPAICFPIYDRTSDKRLIYSIQLVGKRNGDIDLLSLADDVASTLLDRCAMSLKDD